MDYSGYGYGRSCRLMTVMGPVAKAVMVTVIVGAVVVVVVVELWLWFGELWL